MKFIKQMKEANESKKVRERLIKSGMGKFANHRTFEMVEAGKYKVSIQASSSHYCSPRETIEDLSKYENMEIAIFDKHRDFIGLEDFEEFSRIKELGESFEGMVYGHVAVDLIEDLIDFMKEME